MARLCLLSFVVLALLVVLLPVGSDAASVYGQVHLGERIESGDIRAVTLGGSMQMFVDSLGVLQMNTALLSKIPRVTIGANQYLALDEGRSDDYSERDISAVFSGFKLVFPTLVGIRLAVGYVGRFTPDGGYAVRGLTQGGNAYTTAYTRGGSFFSLPITTAFDVTRYASVGLTFSFEQGTVEDRYDILFDDESFNDGVGLKKEDLSAHGFGAGVVFYPFPGLVVGGTYDGKIDYDGEAYEKYTQTGLDTSYATAASIPARFSVGVSWLLRGDFLFLASAAWSDFTKFRGLAFPTDRLLEERDFAFGFEYVRGIPIKRRHLPLRLSFSYHELPFDYPLEPANRKQVTSYLVGFGTGFKVGDGRGKIDLGILVGTQGSIADNGLEDRLVRIYLGLSGSEIWKRKGGRME